MDIRKMQDELGRLVAAERAILDNVERESRSLSGEEREQLARIEADFNDTRATIEAAKSAEERQREADEARAGYESVIHPKIVDEAFDSRNSKAEEDVLNFLRGKTRSVEVDLRGVAAEKRILRTGGAGRREFRDLLVGTAGAGGNLVPTTFVRELYDYLEIYSGVRRLNVRVITTTGGENMDVPKVVSHGTAVIVGEGSAIPEADPSFGTVTLGAWKYGQLVQISNEMLSDSGVPVLSFVAEDCARAIARATDTDYTVGTGTNEPLGFMTAAGTAVTGANGGTGVPSSDNLIDMIYSVNSAYRRRGAEFAVSDSAMSYVRKMKDTTGNYLWEPGWQNGEPDRLMGYPIIDLPNIAATGTGIKSMAFGDFSAYWIRDVGTVRFERSDDFAFANDLVTFRSIFRTDGDLIDLTGAIKVFRGGTA